MNFKDILNYLQGKKTYLVIILAAIFNLGTSLGLWTMDNKYWELVNVILGFIGFGTIRSAIYKSVK